ncbi:hypothetical protein EMIT0P74_60010 [Pseudomonas sp. IT-P74]
MLGGTFIQMGGQQKKATPQYQVKISQSVWNVSRTVLRFCLSFF